jgi:hypothetical protein
VNPNTQPCPDCKGSGRFGAASQYRCDICRGKGYVRKLATDPRNFARRDAYRRANLLDPQHCHGRTFPDFTPGMSTAAYIKSFQAMNGGDTYHRHTGTAVGPLTFDHAQRPAPMLDPLVPEVTFEHDADCIEPSPALVKLMGWK